MFCVGFPGNVKPKNFDVSVLYSFLKLLIRLFLTRNDFRKFADVSSLESSFALKSPQIKEYLDLYFNKQDWRKLTLSDMLFLNYQDIYTLMQFYIWFHYQVEFE